MKIIKLSYWKMEETQLGGLMFAYDTVFVSDSENNLQHNIYYINSA